MACPVENAQEGCGGVVEQHNVGQFEGRLRAGGLRHCQARPLEGGEVGHTVPDDGDDLAGVPQRAHHLSYLHRGQATEQGVFASDARPLGAGQPIQFGAGQHPPRLHEVKIRGRQTGLAQHGQRPFGRTGGEGLDADARLDEPADHLHRLGTQLAPELHRAERHKLSRQPGLSRGVMQRHAIGTVRNHQRARVRGMPGR